MNAGNGSKTQPGLLAPLTAQELTRLEAALDAAGPSWGIAARLMGRLGLRVGEVNKLRWKHIQLTPADEPRIHILAEITKTGYHRSLPIPPLLASLLLTHQNLAKERRTAQVKPTPRTGEDSTFFDEPVITLKNGQPPTVRYMQLVIHKVALSALNKKIKPHTLRHTFATRLLKTTNIRVVQAALGHRSLRSTQIYTHPTMGDLREAIEKTEREET